MEKLGEELNGEGGIDAAFAEKRHCGTENGDDLIGVVVRRVGYEAAESCVELVGETAHEVSKRGLNCVGKRLLRLNGESADVPVGLQEMQKFRSVR